MNEYRIVRLIRNDIVNSFLLNKARKRKESEYVELYRSFDISTIVFEVMGFTNEQIEKGEIVSWYSSQVDLICKAYVGKPEYNLNEKVAHLYFKLKEQANKQPPA